MNYFASEKLPEWEEIYQFNEFASIWSLPEVGTQRYLVVQQAWMEGSNKIHYEKAIAIDAAQYMYLVEAYENNDPELLPRLMAIATDRPRVKAAYGGHTYSAIYIPGYVSISCGKDRGPEIAYYFHEIKIVVDIGYSLLPTVDNALRLVQSREQPKKYLDPHSYLEYLQGDMPESLFQPIEQQLRAIAEITIADRNPQ
jgi:hypothetical protein